MNIIYVRMSREDLRDSAESLEHKFERHIEGCRALAKTHGIVVDAPNIYTERESRTTVEGRAVLMRLLQYCRQGSIDYFITMYQDRVLGGDLGDVDTIEGAFIDGRVKLLTTERLTDFGDENYSTNDALMVRMKAVVDNQYVATIAKKRRESNKTRAAKGHRSQGFAPYGYRWVPAKREMQREIEPPHYEIIPEEYEIVEEIFRRLPFDGAPTICSDLNKRYLSTGKPIPPGINRTSNAAPHWSRDAILRMATNPHYAGFPESIITVGRKGRRMKRVAPISPDSVMDYPHPITRAEQSELRAIMKNRNTFKSVNLSENLCIGLIYCHQGDKMVSGGGTYACKCREQGKRHKSQKMTREKVDEAIIRLIEQVASLKNPTLLSPPGVPKVNKKVVATKLAKAVQDLFAIEGDVNKLLTNRNDLVKLFGLAQYEQTAKAKMKEKETAQALVDTLRAQVDQPDASETMKTLVAIQHYTLRTLLEGMTIAEKRTVVRGFIKRIDLVSPEEGEARVRYLRVTLTDFFQNMTPELIDVKNIIPHYTATREPVRFTCPCSCGCGQIVSKKPSHAREGANHFATRDCYRLWRVGKDFRKN